MQIKQGSSLLEPGVFRLVALIYGLPGTGKTTWIGSAPADKLGIAACETGLGSGILSIADKNPSYCEPKNLTELEEFCRGDTFPDKEILCLDSISAMSKTFIKDAALSIPRAKGESPKRKLGIPELDDYGSIAEMIRKTINLLIRNNPTKHIIVTALEKYDKPGENDAPGTEALIGPELAGQMFLAAPAMFDSVFRMRTRPKLKNPADAKSRYSERYILTQQESGMICKSRNNSKGVPILDKEEVFDPITGKGGFEYIVNKIIAGYKQ